MVQSFRNASLLILCSLGLAVSALASETSIDSEDEPGLQPVSKQWAFGAGNIEIEKAQAPFFPWGDSRVLISFEYKGKNLNSLAKFPSGPRLVAVAFDFENYKELHALAKNEMNVYFLIYDLGRKNQKHLLDTNSNLNYRLIVDGVWMQDPNNPNTIAKANGALVSYIPAKNLPELPIISPEFLDEKAQYGLRNIRLSFRGKAGQEIYVAGTFNGFDPYLTMMQEKRPGSGLYTIDLKLRTGEYYYYFVVDGKKITDPLNRLKGYGREDFRPTYSRIEVLERGDELAKAEPASKSSGH